MKKNIVQDVIPPKKSIRNIELPRRKETVEREVKIERTEAPINLVKDVRPTPSFARPVQNNTVKPQAESPKIPSYNYEYDNPKKSSKKILYFSIGVFVLALIFGISALFKGATISVTPIQETKTLDQTFTAKKDTVKNELGFQVVTIGGNEEKTVTGTGEEVKVEKKATGKVVLYNNYSTTEQKLVATTRLETPEGLIFRLVNNATIPGKKTVSGKTTPGSVEVDVIANAAGETYNIGLKDFTIVGFKGDPKYKDVYGRSKTAMVGGYSGMQKTVSKDILDSAEKTMNDNLKENLSRDIASQIPADFILYPNSLSYKFEATTQSDGGSGSVILKKRATANAIIFDKGTLSRAILAKVAPSIGDNMIKIVNLDTLNFSYASSSASFDPNTSSTATFSLKGDVNMVWVFDENKLKTDLLGLSKDSAKTVISKYSAIKEAWIETRPFWNKTIPTNPKKVTVVNTLTK